jgi:excisionase family DNA binding protein
MSCQPVVSIEESTGMLEQKPVVVVPRGWFKTSEAAELAGYCVKRVQELACAGCIRAVKIGGEWLVHKDDLLEHHATAKPGPKPKRQRGTKAITRNPDRSHTDAGRSSLIKGEGTSRVAAQEPIVIVPTGWLRTPKAAELAECSTGRVRQLALSGRIRAVKIGYKWLVHTDDLLAYRATAKPGRKSAKHQRARPIVFRQSHCLWCGTELEHKATGRPREFCSDKCRVSYWRAEKWVPAGDLELPRDLGFPAETVPYTICPDGVAVEHVKA